MNDKKRIGPCLIFNFNKYKKFRNYLEVKILIFQKKLIEKITKNV